MTSSAHHPAVFDELRQADQLADGLALLIVRGPPSRAAPGLALIAAALEDGTARQVWHRLDTDGPRIADTVERTVATSGALVRPIALVHGLERIAVQHERHELLDRLNALRDSLDGARATIVLWIARPGFDEFQRYCPDLYQWRSLVADLADDDVPLAPAEVFWRRYLEKQYRWVDKLTAADVGASLSEVFVEPQVRDQAGYEQPLLGWADSVHRGVLYAPPGSGKLIALRRITQRQVLTLLNDAKEIVRPRGPWIPLLVTAHAFHQRLGMRGEGIHGLLSGATPAIDSGMQFVIEALERGQLRLIISLPWILDDSLNGLLMSELSEVTGNARMLVAISTPPPAHFDEDINFDSASMLPWDFEQAEAYLRKRLGPRSYALIDALSAYQQGDERERQLAEWWISSPVEMAALVDAYSRIGGMPEDAIDIRAFLESLVEEERDVGVSGLRGTRSPPRRSPQERVRSLAPSKSTMHDELVEILEGFRSLRGWHLRALIIERLLPTIAVHISRGSALRADWHNIVSACASSPGGLQALRDAVYQFEGDTFAMRRLDALLSEIEAI